jgi:hypothetical protein
MWAQVPETTVYKDGKPVLREYKVGFSKERIVTPPTHDSRPPHEGNQPQFGRTVALAANFGHYLRSFFRRENVSHQPFTLQQE